MCARCFIAKLHIQLYITFVYLNVIENAKFNRQICTSDSLLLVYLGTFHSVPFIIRVNFVLYSFYN